MVFHPLTIIKTRERQMGLRLKLKFADLKSRYQRARAESINAHPLKTENQGVDIIVNLNQ